MADYFVHPAALCETEEIGDGTSVWAFAHLMKGVKVGARCNIGDHVFVESGVRLGDGVTVKNGVALWEGVEIEDYVFIGPNAVFTNDLMPRSPRLPGVAERYADKGWREPTVVEEGASIGANATIVCGVRIGRYAMVGAGSVVTRDVPPYGLVYGVPARLHGYVDEQGRLRDEA